jgi:arylsulfatase A-like enzyme
VPPAPYEGFQGRVGRTFAGSEPWWPERPTAPAGAPNVIVVLADDLGFSDLGCYGSEIETPHLDRLAREGVRYANFHVNPMCSPTRASLLTGVNAHLAGVGHVAHSDPGFPGYAMELSDNVATAAEILRAHGYGTLMVGKWHLCKDSDISEAGSQHSWPVQRGFDRFYGFLDGFTNLHQPHRLYEDNHVVAVDTYPDGYYLTDDLTDRAIGMVKALKASNPTKPFFLYFAHGAVHAPLLAKTADMDKYRGAYEDGWDVIRVRRHRRQIDLGVLPPGTRLPPRNREENHDVRPWEDLSPRERALFARYMEVFAAMVDNLDQSFGRLRSALEEMGEWENSIVIFTSDNGASREGEEAGTTQYFRLVGLLGRSHLDTFEEDYERLDLVGGPRSLPHYPRGWAMASNTPFRLYKVNTHAGGHQVPFILSWPARVPAAPDIRTQYAHVTDVLPTLLDLIGLAAPAERQGQPLRPVAGRSFAASLRDATAPDEHGGQYYEMIGHRGFYAEGWEVVALHQPMTPFGDHEWELYDLATDPTETTDLAADHPDRVAELAAEWERAAWANQVFPLDEGSRLRWVERPPSEDVYAEPVTIWPGTPTLERYRSLLLIQGRSFAVRVAFEEHRHDDRGVLVAHGGQGGGYLLAVENGELVFAHNGYGVMRILRAGPVAAGVPEVGLEVSAPGKWRWDVRLTIAGRTVAEETGFPMLSGMAPFEGIDVGADRRSPVWWELYEKEGAYPYSGRLRSVTYVPGELAPDAGRRWVQFLRDQGSRFE